MHLSSYLRMEWFVKTYLAEARPMTVLDVGSCAIEGSGSYKPLFQQDKFSYKGLDIEAGANVDIVAATPYLWPMIPDKSIDAVISGQTFEHNEFFWFTVREMVRVLKDEGLLCIIAPRNAPIHRFPVDVYRFDADGMIALARFGGLDPLHASTNLAPADAPLEWFDEFNGDSMLVARKPADWAGFADPATYKFEPADMDALKTGFVRGFSKRRPIYVPLPPAKKRSMANVEFRTIRFVHSLFKRINPKGHGWR